MEIKDLLFLDGLKILIVLRQGWQIPDGGTCQNFQNLTAFKRNLMRLQKLTKLQKFLKLL